jgi:hypothetical protein
VGGRFAALVEKEKEDDGIEETWAAIKETFNSTSAEILGKRKLHHEKDWLSDRSRLLSDKRHALKPHKKESTEKTTHYNYLWREIKRNGKADKEAYLNQICKEIEDANVQNKSRAVYQSIRGITGKTETRIRSIKDKNGKTLTEPTEIRDRWREHFNELYNVQIVADSAMLSKLPICDGNSQDNYTPKLLREEVEAAVPRMKQGKSPSVNNVTADEMQAA